jgi:hypothetical protein
MCNKILNAKFKGDKYFVDEVETQLREKPLQGSQTQDIHYSKDKASYKLTCNPTRTPPNQVSYVKGSSMESFTLGPTPEIDFKADQIIHWEKLES